MEKYELVVNGMSCKHCVVAVTEAIQSVMGAKEILVSLDEKKASFRLDSSEKLVAVTQEIVAEGYEVVG
ncbi:MAG: heavy metal-associated domain-containing protein [Spirochaetota bacterium]